MPVVGKEQSRTSAAAHSESIWAAAAVLQKSIIDASIKAVESSANAIVT